VGVSGEVPRAPYLPAALQVAQRRARLICRPRLNRDRRDLAGLGEREKPSFSGIDMLDYAVVMTLRQGGQVWSVDQEALQSAARTAAILRY